MNQVDKITSPIEVGGVASDFVSAEPRIAVARGQRRWLLRNRSVRDVVSGQGCRYSARLGLTEGTFPRSVNKCVPLVQVRIWGVV